MTVQNDNEMALLRKQINETTDTVKVLELMQKLAEVERREERFVAFFR